MARTSHMTGRLIKAALVLACLAAMPMAHARPAPESDLSDFKGPGNTGGGSSSGDSVDTKSAAAILASTAQLGGGQPSNAAPVPTPVAATPAAPVVAATPAQTVLDVQPSPVTPLPPPVVGGNCPDGPGALDVANSVRAAYGAGPLAWSPGLAASAQASASGCSLDHTTLAGENLMIGPALSGCVESVQGWAAEAPYYAPGADFTPAAAHFTQLVWKGSSEMGCGMADCGGTRVVVCHFNAPGNVVGAVAANVGK